VLLHRKAQSIPGKNKDWLARNQDNLSEWSNLYTHRLLSQWTSTIEILCVLNTIFTNILLMWLKLILFVGKSGLPSENNWPASSQWQSLSNEVVFWTTSPTIIWSLQGKPSNLVLKICCSLESDCCLSLREQFFN
jgi:hypothetical protein